MEERLVEGLDCLVINEEVEEETLVEQLVVENEDALLTAATDTPV